MFLIALALMNAVPAGKGPLQIYSFPDINSCANWTSEREKSGYRSQILDGWVLGFISGYNAFGPNDGGSNTGITADGMVGWISNYCKANPLDSVTTAAFKLTSELKKRSGR